MLFCYLAADSIITAAAASAAAAAAAKVVVILSMPLIRVVWVQFKNQRANYLTHHPQSPDKIERIKIPSWIRQY